jgi:anti-sigma regulatory factor (Ser/Thr protein kinase)
VRLDRRFPAAKRSVPEARQFVAGALNGAPADVRDSVMLMVSELAMNAVQHARTQFTVAVELAGKTLQVEVADAGTGVPEICPAPPVADLHGRGLFIVERLSDAWGVAPALSGPGKSVWFRIGLLPESSPESSPLAQSAS